jgi:3-hydroxyacyl-[acyl-carrier-protein] dehydratase
VSEELLPGVVLRDLRRPTAGELAGELEVAVGHAAFDGHFPGRPVLPAVAQLQIVVALCRRLLGQAVRVEEVCRVKFVRPVEPGARLSFLLAVDGQHLRWSLRRDDEPVSTGVLGIGR